MVQHVGKGAKKEGLKRLEGVVTEKEKTERTLGGGGLLTKRANRKKV